MDVVYLMQIQVHFKEYGHSLKRALPCIVPLGFFACPSGQAPSPNLDEESIGWNCKADNVAKGEDFTIVNHVDPVDRCYFEFTHQDNNYRCCYQNKDDNYCEALSYTNGSRMPQE